MKKNTRHSGFSLFLLSIFLACISIRIGLLRKLRLASSKRFGLSEPATFPTTVIPNIEIAKCEPFIFLILEKLRLKSLGTFVLGVLYYYGITFVMNLFQGTAIPAVWIQELQNIFHFYTPLSRMIGLLPRRHIQVYMVFDVPHLLAGIMVGASLSLAADGLQRGIAFFEYMVKENLFNTSLNNYKCLAEGVNQSFKWIWARVIAIVLGATILTGFILLVRAPQSQIWWGNNSYGIAGYYLSFAVSFWVYLATWAGICALRALPIYSNFLSKHWCTIRPVWHDGANGLQLWGNVIFEAIFASLGIGTVLLAVAKLGYFGIEKTPFFWIIAFCYFMILPVIFTAPIVPLVRNISRSKNKELEKIARQIQKRFDLMLVSIMDGKINSNLLVEINHLQEMYTKVENVSIFPFNKKLVQSSLTTYLVQIVILLMQKFLV